ncbi:MAG: DMT family transporter [Methylovulum miyakonense]|uniref:DMT family transporter n=1 Tax=Methylovulum miyakonense TaxID=645578 RepID=UPI003BB75FDE
MPIKRAYFLAFLAMIAFAGNSLLCRLALKHAVMDAASFTTIRIMSGALVLGLLVRLRGGGYGTAGSWWSALALFVYAAGFSFAYIHLPTALGALLLFGAVQATMLGYGLWHGERLSRKQTVAIICSFAGFVALLSPPFAAPPLPSALLMTIAGVAWGVYSLRGKQAGDPLMATAGNFLRASAFAAALSLVLWAEFLPDKMGVVYAIASGAVASGLGYAIWYKALSGLPATHAATMQLSVPVFAAVGGVIFLGEAITLHFFLTSTVILGGIAVMIFDKAQAP